MDINAPALRYHGGKWRLAPWIIEHFPAPTSIECYVEPFCGAASVFLQKTPSPIEVLNDLDGNLVNFFQILREHTTKLVRAICLTPYSRREYEIAWRSFENLNLDPLEQARRYYIRVWQGWGGFKPAHPAGWRFQRSGSRGSAATADWNRWDHLVCIARRLKDALIECDEALKVIERYDAPATLFYLDPPYLPSLRRWGRDAYQAETDTTYHRALLERIRDLEGMAIISGYPSELYDEYLPDWGRAEKLSRTTNYHHQARETLWVSPAAMQNQRQTQMVFMITGNDKQ
jgi:DNA adenine methylase